MLDRPLLPSLFNSLKGRLIVASVFLLPLACGLLGWSLDRAYSNSLLESQKRQMITQSYALMAAAELEGDTLWLPEKVTDDRFNQLSSGAFAQVFSAPAPKPVWQSVSASDTLLLQDESSAGLKAGDTRFGIKMHSGEPLFYLLYRVDWESAKGRAQPFIFAIYETMTDYKIQADSYRQTLWLWLSSIALGLILLQLVILLWGLRPLDKVVADLSLVQQGQTDRLDGAYPEELRGMTSSINKLLEHEHAQRMRYRDTLADLAHSIKNPVTIISGALRDLKRVNSSSELDDIEEQNQRINQIISYHLSKAVGQSAAPFNQAVLIKPVVEKLASAMHKVYAGKNMSISIDVPEDVSFRGDHGDLMELIGNLLDNACKYGQQQVVLSVRHDSGSVTLCIEDDGSGISQALQERLLKRGERADTSVSGQGIGLAVVEDIVSNYRGTIELEKSSFGGLQVEIKFPLEIN